MTAIDLSQKLKKYKSGWVALDGNYNVVAHARTFSDIEKKIKGKKNHVSLMPVSDNYFGFVT